MRFLAVMMMALVLAACGSSPKKQQAPQGYYRVQKGDTLSKIARQHGQSVNALMRNNNIRNPNHIQVGQLLRVQGGSASPPAASGTSTVQAPKATTAQSVAAPRSIKLIWPAPGSHRRGTGPQSQGVFITRAEGTPIKAAAAGKVMYAGNGLRGYGNMVIISHDANFISVYAHNKSLAVKEGQSVKQGQTIAQMGRTDTNTTQLYFELRYNGKAVDATRHLPAK
ncbi:MAG: M23 family metallopeptidase [Alcaligenaceae bacterium]|nr:M23 family metallopeptidase [Alcaligenaceae bacterium]